MGENEENVRISIYCPHVLSALSNVFKPYFPGYHARINIYNN